MKREFLKGLGVADENIEKIMAEHKKELQAETAKADAKEAELTAANSTIAGLRNDIKKYDGVDVDDLKKKADDWEARYNADIQTERGKADLIRREYALKNALKEKGVAEPDYIIYKNGGVEKFAFDGEGNPVGVDDILKPYKESSPALFSGSENSSVTVDLGGGSGTPAGNADRSANAQFNAMLRGALAK